MHERIFHTNKTAPTKVREILNQCEINYAFSGANGKKLTRIKFLRSVRDAKSYLIVYVSFLVCYTPTLLIGQMNESVEHGTSVSAWGIL